MTEAEAWLKIAEAFETLPKNRDSDQRHMTSSGLCKAVIEIEYSGQVRAGVPARMYNRITKACPSPRVQKLHYWPVRVRRSDLIRAKLARKFAAQARRKK